jgi:hypothetical protein
VGSEHSEPDKAQPPPQDTVIVTCSCCWAAYRYSPSEVFDLPEIALQAPSQGPERFVNSRFADGCSATII